MRNMRNQRTVKGFLKEFKTQIRWGIIGLFALILISIFMMSWKTVDPGFEGFIYKPYGSGVEIEKTYKEGTHLIAPWNDIIVYDLRQQSRDYNSKVMDKNGTDISVIISVNFHVSKGESGKLHLLHGKNYSETFIDKKTKGAIKDVIGRYTYVEVYSSKREILEQEIEAILEGDFDGNYILLDFVEIADINLPDNIASEITNKETQKQRNQTAKEKEKEQEYLANARIEKARGDSALLVSAQYKAKAIQVESHQLKNNPEYIELKKWESWDGKGSPYGNNNVFGDKSISILKGN